MDEIERWLDSQPLDEPIDINGELVYLRVQGEGAELGLYLSRDYTPAQLEAALKKGFNSALNYSAGLGVSTDDHALVLTQWLPGVTRWIEAADPLEQLLNQAELWRRSVKSVQIKPVSLEGNRNEQRLRMAFAGAKK